MGSRNSIGVFTINPRPFSGSPNFMKRCFLWQQQETRFIHFVLLLRGNNNNMNL
jgi:hypothetical protein